MYLKQTVVVLIRLQCAAKMSIVSGKMVNFILIVGGDGFKTRDELVEMLKTSTYYSPKELRLRYPNTDWNNTDEVDDIIRDEGWLTEEQYWDDIDMKTFCESYTTSSGEEIMAFGYYGYDG